MAKVGERVTGLARVAREAGVSPATVSRSFNSPELVSREVMARIREVAERLGYSPNPAARALRSRRTRIVGAAIPTLDYAIFATMMDSFQDELALHGYTTIVLTTGFDNRQTFEKVRLLRDRGAEAILFVGAIEDERLRRLIGEAEIPMVTTYSHLPDEIVPSVGFDNFAATAAAMDHLIGLGHREFAMIAGNLEGNDRQRARVAAYRHALSRHGLGGADRIEHGSYHHGMRKGAAAVARLLDAHPEITAVVCNTDIFVVGVLAECRKRGLRVPDDVSVIGFDDQEFASLLDPPITTVAVPAAEMGARAARMLHAALSSGEPLRHERLPTPLVVRGSTGAPRAADHPRGRPGPGARLS